MIRCKKIAVILAVFSAMGMVVQGQGNGDNIAFSQGGRTPLPALAPAAYEGHFWRVDAEMMPLCLGISARVSHLFIR